MKIKGVDVKDILSPPDNDEVIYSYVCSRCGNTYEITKRHLREIGFRFNPFKQGDSLTYSELAGIARRWALVHSTYCVQKYGWMG